MDHRANEPGKHLRWEEVHKTHAHEIKECNEREEVRLRVFDRSYEPCPCSYGDVSGEYETSRESRTNRREYLRLLLLLLQQGVLAQDVVQKVKATGCCLANLCE